MEDPLGYERTSPRVEKILMTGIEHYGDTGELAEASIGRTLNISEGGILLEVVKPFPFMSQVALNLALFNNNIQISGQIVHLRKNVDARIEMGITFTKMSEKDRETLKMFIS